MTDNNGVESSQDEGERCRRTADGRARWWKRTCVVLALAETLAVSRNDTALACMARAVRIIGDVVVSRSKH
jgi:hypothetical protein